ncbi:MAG TPA: NUDIX hydrolase [Candidatus Paceibacterota bacterium]
MESKQPKVGVGVAIVRDGKLLLGKRKGSHGAGEWSFPGGHLEYGESWEVCGAREVLEETGLAAEELRFIGVTNDIFPEAEKHYITLFMTGTARGEPELREPEKCEEWGWFPIDDLPQPLFPPIVHLLEKGFTTKEL